MGIKPKNFSLSDWLRVALLTFWKLLTNWERYDILIAEMGIDSPLPPKNMEYLLTIVKPDLGIFLNAAPMHSEPFDFLVSETNPEKRRQKIIELITAEKGKILTRLPEQSTAVVNIDQPELRKLVSEITAQVISFGTSKVAMVKIVSSKPSLKGTTFTFEINSERYTLDLKEYVLAAHYASSFAVALAVGIQQNIPLSKICKNIETHFTLEPGRSTLIPGINDSFILDSSYNSSTSPTIDMLAMLPKLGAKRSLALLGDIREIGTMTETEHLQVAEAAAKYLDAIFLVGPQMKKYALPYLQKQKKKVRWFKDAVEAGEHLRTFMQKEDILLVKSSQNTLFLETTVEMLMAHPEDADDFLCRRGAFWDAKRSEAML